MTSLHPATAACNAVPSPVRTDAPKPIPTRRDAIPFPAVLTEELFQRWLDLHPGRRRHHERCTPEVQQRDRDRVARMYALRGSPVTVAYAQALDAAQVLHDALESLLRLYGSHEAERVLLAAGLRVPHEHDIDQCWGGDTFEEQHGDCKKMKRRIDDFIDSLFKLTYILPDGDPEDPRLVPAEGA